MKKFMNIMNSCRTMRFLWNPSCLPVSMRESASSTRPRIYCCLQESIHRRRLHLRE